MAKQRVLILCTGNSARSPMAQGLLAHDSGDRFEVEGAGTRPSRVRPEAVAVMHELGIDTLHRSKHADELPARGLTTCSTYATRPAKAARCFPPQQSGSITASRIRLLWRDLKPNGWCCSGGCAMRSG
ncbi:MAG TPA: hypothetical protein VEV17_05435, partial [Bryobacteraceae bacterium]|nr:hypothetical protein [Bryobacteraceae bacterium]